MLANQPITMGLLKLASDRLAELRGCLASADVYALYDARDRIREVLAALEFHIENLNPETLAQRIEETARTGNRVEVVMKNGDAYQGRLIVYRDNDDDDCPYAIVSHGNARLSYCDDDGEFWFHVDPIGDASQCVEIRHIFSGEEAK